jgi:hypothetical protein
MTISNKVKPAARRLRADDVWIFMNERVDVSCGRFAGKSMPCHAKVVGKTLQNFRRRRRWQRMRGKMRETPTNPHFSPSPPREAH